MSAARFEQGRRLKAGYKYEWMFDSSPTPSLYLRRKPKGSETESSRSVIRPHVVLPYAIPPSRRTAGKPETSLIRSTTSRKSSAGRSSPTRSTLGIDPTPSTQSSSTAPSSGGLRDVVNGIIDSAAGESGVEQALRDKSQPASDGHLSPSEDLQSPSDRQSPPCPLYIPQTPVPDIQQHSPIPQVPHPGPPQLSIDAQEPPAGNIGQSLSELPLEIDFFDLSGFPSADASFTFDPDFDFFSNLSIPSDFFSSTTLPDYSSQQSPSMQPLEDLQAFFSSHLPLDPQHRPEPSQDPLYPSSVPYAWDWQEPFFGLHLSLQDPQPYTTTTSYPSTDVVPVPAPPTPSAFHQQRAMMATPEMRC